MGEELKPGERRKVTTYCGCDIYEGAPYPPGTYWSPCIVGAYRTVKAVKKRIKKAGYCRSAKRPKKKPPEGINRSYLGFEGTLKERIERAGVQFLISTELQLYGRAIHPLKLTVKLAESSENWDEDEMSWWYQPKAEDIVVGETTDIPSREGWYSVPLNLEKIKDIENFSLQLVGRESGANNYCYAGDRESDTPPRIVIKAIKVT